MTAEIPDGEEGPENVEGDGDVSEERAAVDRRRRTDAQRAKRLAARICGWCRVSADYCRVMMILWYSRTRKDRRLRARQIAICEWCLELLSSDEDTPEWCLELLGSDEDTPEGRQGAEAGEVAQAARAEGPLTERQRRTAAQRDKRAAERICGWCRAPADHGWVEWSVSEDTFQEVAICEECYRKLKVRRGLRNEEVNDA